MSEPLDLARPMPLRAEMARRGFAPGHLLSYDSPDHGWVNPLDDAQVQNEVRRFMAEVWKAALDAEHRAKSDARTGAPS